MKDMFKSAKLSFELIFEWLNCLKVILNGTKVILTILKSLSNMHKQTYRVFLG